MSSEDSHSYKETHSVDSPGVGRIQVSGEGNEFVHIGKNRYYKHELMEAFGGTLNPGLSPYPKHQFANPSPLGLCGFALTTFCLSMYNAQAMGIDVPNVVVGLACFYGGTVQLFAGIWEGLIGNTFALCALTSYGAFWLSYAAIQISAFGIADAYDGTDQLHSAVGLYLMAWALFTFMLFLCTLKSTLAFSSLFFMLTLTYILLSIGDFTSKTGVVRAGGVTGVITAFIAFYNAFAGVATPQNSYFGVKVLSLTRS